MKKAPKTNLFHDERWNSSEQISPEEKKAFFPEMFPIKEILLLLPFIFLTVTLWFFSGKYFYEKGPDNDLRLMSYLESGHIRLVHRLKDGTLSSEIPSWIREDLCEEFFQRLATDSDDLSIYNSEQINHITQKLEEFFWIKEVKRIEKYYPAYLEIEVEYRKPVLVATFKKTLHAQEEGKAQEAERIYFIPISQDCRVVTPYKNKYSPVSKKELDAGFPVFCGGVPDNFDSTKENMKSPLEFCNGHFFKFYPKPGQNFSNDKDLKEAVEIVKELGDNWYRYKFKYIFIENMYSKDKIPNKEFCIITQNGSHIHWGRHVTRENKNKEDILDEDKLKKLEKEFQENREIWDSPDNPMTLDFIDRSYSP